MNKQQIFDIVSQHLLRQNASCEVDGVCLYRSGENRCAVGILIPDDIYEDAMEGKEVYDLVQNYSFPSWFVDNVDFLKKLQFIHDGYEPKHWRDKLYYCARANNLVFSESPSL